jgi:hypothetical protein
VEKEFWEGGEREVDDLWIVVGFMGRKATVKEVELRNIIKFVSRKRRYILI